MLHPPKIPKLDPSLLPSVLAFLRRRPIVAYSAGGVILLILIWFFAAGGTVTQADLSVTPSKGLFLVTVTTTGELQAKNSINIMGSENARAANIWQMKITNIVPEGTVVKKGQFVADLDKSEITGKFKDSQLSIQKFDAQYPPDETRQYADAFAGPG